MEITQKLAGAQWRKSSYSGSGGGECVECAPFNGTTWRKSTHSSDTGGDCIEFAPRQGTIAVRDSKNPEGPAFTTTPRAFATFVEAAANGTLR
ncbi:MULTISPECIES: DUF397 domain-containing protein [unclassified Streptomyces]|uniref:DUF397 domain-containing protein n=1 Tax=unclassified Streptomyces TaxID=2593676 RepID=UPI0033305DA8